MVGIKANAAQLSITMSSGDRAKTRREEQKKRREARDAEEREKEEKRKVTE